MGLIFFQYYRKKRLALSSLSQWRHINCLKTSAARVIQDNVLRSIVSRSDKTVTSTVENVNLLAAVDLDALEHADSPFNAREVAAGTVSYLFERSSVEAL
jgi:DNA repair and recombination protein RAD54B